MVDFTLLSDAVMIESLQSDLMSMIHHTWMQDMQAAAADISRGPSLSMDDTANSFPLGPPVIHTRKPKRTKSEMSAPPPLSRVMRSSARSSSRFSSFSSQ